MHAPLLLALLLLAGPALAQVPVARTAPIPLARGADLLDPALFPAAGPATPDTTAPWRYYPLHLGDAWEYFDFARGLDYVLMVGAEEFHGGRRYAVIWGGHVEPRATALIASGANPRLRFDTTSARVLEYNEGNEILWEPCPFDAPWGAAVSCAPYPYGPATVSGGYGQVLVFPEGEPPDTLVTAVKTFDMLPTSWYEIRTYAADLGLVYLEDEFRLLGLYYARIDGVEYGRPRHPVSAAAEPEAPGALRLAVTPNPVRSSAEVVLVLPEAGAARVALYDVLGREVARIRDGPLAAGVHRLGLPTSGLPPGAYVLRAEAGGVAASARVSVVR